jgi:hypothetical protein
LHTNTTAQAVQYQGLLRLSQTQLPRRTCMLN